MDQTGHSLLSHRNPLAFPGSGIAFIPRMGARILSMAAKMSMVFLFLRPLSAQALKSMDTLSFTRTPTMAPPQVLEIPAAPAVDWSLDDEIPEISDSSDYRDACGDGSPSLCALQGYRELNAGNATTGKRLLRSACELNASLGCIQLGIVSLDSKDWKTARWALRKSCDMGVPEACKTARELRRKVISRARGNSPR